MGFAGGKGVEKVTSVVVNRSRKRASKIQCVQPLHSSTSKAREWRRSGVILVGMCRSSKGNSPYLVHRFRLELSSTGSLKVMPGRARMFLKESNSVDAVQVRLVVWPPRCVPELRCLKQEVSSRPYALSCNAGVNVPNLQAPQRLFPHEYRSKRGRSNE